MGRRQRLQLLIELLDDSVDPFRVARHASDRMADPRADRPVKRTRGLELDHLLVVPGLERIDSALLELLHAAARIGPQRLADGLVRARAPNRRRNSARILARSSDTPKGLVR